MSVVIDQHDARHQDSIQFIGLPTTVGHNVPVTVEYHCIAASVVGVEVRVWTETKNDVLVFQRIWHCRPEGSPSKQTSTTKTIKTIKIHLPPNLAYRPSYLNRNSVWVERSVIKGWVLDASLWRPSHMKMAYTAAAAKVSHDIQLLQPLERQPRVFKKCMSWQLLLDVQLANPYSPQCQLEPGGSTFTILNLRTTSATATTTTTTTIT